MEDFLLPVLLLLLLPLRQGLQLEEPTEPAHHDGPLGFLISLPRARREGALIILLLIHLPPPLRHLLLLLLVLLPDVVHDPGAVAGVVRLHMGEALRRLGIELWSEIEVVPVRVIARSRSVQRRPIQALVSFWRSIGPGLARGTVVDTSGGEHLGDGAHLGLEGAFTVVELFQIAPQLVATLHILHRQTIRALLVGLPNKVEVGGDDLPARVGDLWAERAFHLRMLRAHLHAPLLSQLEGLLACEEILLGTLKVNRGLANSPGALIYTRCRGHIRLAQALLASGLPLLELLCLGVEPVLNGAQVLQAVPITLAEGSVQLVSLLLHDPLASPRDPRLERAIRTHILGGLLLAGMCLLHLLDGLGTQVDGGMGILAACAVAVDLGPESVRTHFVGLQELLRLVAEGHALVRLVVQAVRQWLQEATAGAPGVEL
mmetsp:Transcript_41062/g.89647  ORF Transcript_41062/g.89647 Transcript_41062/m.89647 type:complete len:431 (+) Transcript_41062:248-1540(+)